MKILSLSKTSKILAIFFIVILIFFIFPIKIPYSIKTPGKVLPVKEWIIVKDTDGRVITILKDHKNGVSQNYTVTQFERGDAIQFAFKEKVGAGEYIERADTIATVYSNETERLYAQLMGELAVAKASLPVFATGEKEALIKEEKERLQYMKKNAEEQRKIFNRMESLYKRDLISAAEYELAKGNVGLSEIDVAIAEAHVQAVQSGEKPEQINYINFQIQSLEKQLAAVEARFQGYKIVSQISGVVSRVSDGDTLLIVSDTSEYSILLPVKFHERNFVSTNQQVHFKPPYLSWYKDAKVIKKEESVHTINGDQVLFYVASIDKWNKELLPGLMVECSVQCEPVSLVEFLRRIFKVSL